MINNREREYLKYTLAQEKQVLNSLKDIYKKALKEINVKIAYLEARNSVESTTSIIYQLNYQQALKKQIDGILDNLSGKQYEKIQDYLIDCYDNGFVGTMYDLHGQGVPLILPIDQEQVLNALTTNSKLSKHLYDRLGEDIKKLKSTIRHEISRGIASAMSYADIARNIANVSKTGINNAFRIARTEGHRIQNESAFDAMNKAKDKGADVVKQWDATLDGRTRKTHRELDGKIVEVNEPFIFNGHKAMYPGGFGVASLDINCRCAVLTRAKWALDEEELTTLEEKASYFELDKTKGINQFKEKYLKTIEKNTKDDTIKLKIGEKIPSDSIITIHENKINKFYLKEGTKHYSDFIDVGYSIELGDLLYKDLLIGLKETPISEIKRRDNGEIRVIVDMLLGVTKRKTFRTVWICDESKMSFRNVTVYRYSKE